MADASSGHHMCSACIAVTSFAKAWTKTKFSHTVQKPQLHGLTGMSVAIQHQFLSDSPVSIPNTASVLGIPVREMRMITRHMKSVQDLGRQQHSVQDPDVRQ